MQSRLNVLPDTTALARAAAAHFVEIAQASIALNRRFTVALSGGSTPEPMYRLLPTPEFSSQIDWQQVHLFWSDERCVPPSHPDSNYGMACRAFIDNVPISIGNIHRILGEEDPIVAAEAYEQELKDHFKAALPRFDLILLGLGVDGHTASIFPGSTTATESKRLAVAVQHPGTNQWRITLTFPIINAASHIQFLVSGTSKAPALKTVLNADGGVIDFPAKGVNSDSEKVSWFVDQDAGGNLGRERH